MRFQIEGHQFRADHVELPFVLQGRRAAAEDLGDCMIHVVVHTRIRQRPGNGTQNSDIRNRRIRNESRQGRRFSALRGFIAVGINRRHHIVVGGVVGYCAVGVIARRDARGDDAVATAGGRAAINRVVRQIAFGIIRPVQLDRTDTRQCTQSRRGYRRRGVPRNRIEVNFIEGGISIPMIFRDVEPDIPSLGVGDIEALSRIIVRTGPHSQVDRGDLRAPGAVSRVVARSTRII